MKTIFLVDYHYGGHHLTYLKLLSKVLLEMGYQVVALSLEPEKLQRWVEVQSPNYIDHFLSFPVSKPEDSLSTWSKLLKSPLITFFRWHYISQTIRNLINQNQLKPDLVFFSWLDDFLSRNLPTFLIDNIFPYPWSGLCLKPFKLDKNLSDSYRYHRQHFRLIQANHCQGMCFLNEDVTQDLQSISSRPILPFPDIADDSPPDLRFEVVEQILQKARGRKIIAAVGSLNIRKGILTLLEVAKRSRHQDWFFVFAGSLPQGIFQNDSFQAAMPRAFEPLRVAYNERPDNCFFYFNFLPDESSLNGVIATADILFAAYEGFPFSSNILTKAAIFKKPVIVSQGYVMSQRVETFNLGLTIPEGSPDDCILALSQLTLSLEANQPSINSQLGFERYSTLSSTERVRDTFLQLIP